jgi:hypothetical protein
MAFRALPTMLWETLPALSVAPSRGLPPAPFHQRGVAAVDTRSPSDESSVACGTPPAGIPEVLRGGETSFPIPAADAQDCAQRIWSLLEDSALYERVAEQAHARTIAESNGRAHGERLLNMYDSLRDHDREREANGGLAAQWRLDSYGALREIVPFGAADGASGFEHDRGVRSSTSPCLDR